MTDNVDIVNRATDCCLFDGGRTGSGYGAMWVNGKFRGAHIVSYKTHKGPVPEGMFVCHTCDNPPCINPDHLFIGTLQDNKRDEVAKGRHAFGEKVGCAKLTAEQVFEIRGLLDKGFSLASLGRRYNVTRQAIFWIKQDKNWSRVA